MLTKGPKYTQIGAKFPFFSFFRIYVSSMHVVFVGLNLDA